MLTVLGFYVACATLNALGALVCTRRSQLLLQDPFYSLPDLGHELLPRLPHYTPDILLVPLTAVTAVACVLWMSADGLGVLVVTHSLLLAGRGLCEALTSAPSCMPDTGGPAWREHVKTRNRFMRLYDAAFHTPCDLMYSGHTALILVCWLAWERYIASAHSATLLCMLGWSRLLAVVGPLSLIGARQHYSVDVMVAVLLCLLLFAGDIPGTVHAFLTQ